MKGSDADTPFRDGDVVDLAETADVPYNRGDGERADVSSFAFVLRSMCASSSAMPAAWAAICHIHLMFISLKTFANAAADA